MLADEVIRLTGPHAADRCTAPLRQVTIWDETQQRTLTFLTNIMHLAASTIAAIYKERWQIELLFKALKQHLRIKTFVGTNKNAVQIQIWIALLAMLLLKFHNCNPPGRGVSRTLRPAPLQSLDLSGSLDLAQCAVWMSGHHPDAHASAALRHVILDSSRGNLIRKPELQPSHTQHSGREDPEGQDYFGQQWVDLVYLVCFVHLINLPQPKKEKPTGSRVSRVTVIDECPYSLRGRFAYH